MTDTTLHHRLVLKVLTALERRGTAARRELEADLAAANVEASDDQVRDALRALRAEGYATCLGAGRSAKWQAVSRASQQQRQLSDQLAFMFGRQHLSFAAKTRLAEPYDRLLKPGDATDVPGDRLERMFHLISEPARDYSDHVDDVNEVIEALLSYRKISFSWKDQGSREVEPLCLVVYRRALYLVTRKGPHDDDVKLYGLDGVRGVRAGETFAYPAPRTWNPRKYFDPWFGVYVGKKRQRYVFRFDADKADLVRARRWHRNQQLTTLPDGRVELTLRTDGLELVRFAHEWGETVEVVAPEGFRAEIQENLRMALGRYGER